MSDTTNGTEYTVEVNGKRYELNDEMREAIRARAENEYSENWMFSCFWKVAHPSQYAVGEWEENMHSKGDPVLVIETEGPFVPWERMDKLQVEMQEVGPESQLDRQMDENSDDADKVDNGNGLKAIDPSDVDDAEREIGRTHFGLTPKSFEEVPSPDGEEADKIPPKPEKVGDEPELVAWVPDYPEIEHSWSAGEAICSMFNRVEWNVQVKANQPRLMRDKDTSHDHWESMLKSYNCEVVAELGPSQRTPSGSGKSSESKQEEDVPKRFDEGTAGGGHWRV